jgi:hypothetical protein
MWAPVSLGVFGKTLKHKSNSVINLPTAANGYILSTASVTKSP